MEKKTGNQIFFDLNILNEAECLVCAQIIRKKCEYFLKWLYGICHTKLYSIMGCEVHWKCIEDGQNSGTWILYFKLIISQIGLHKIFVHYRGT